jgi:glutamyl-tRNA reductase
MVSNRTYERAAALAETLGGKAIHFEQWDAEFSEVDILIGSTGAPHAVVPKAKLAPLMKSRADRPLFCIDLAVPRDFESTVNDLDGVYLYDIDSLQSIADEGLRIRHKELARCEQMIERHVEEFTNWLATPVPEFVGQRAKQSP